MKILLLTSSMHGGGAERVAALLCNQWVENGHKVTLMPTFSGRGECIYPLDSEVKLEFLADVVDGELGKLKRLLTLRKYIKSCKPDVIVSFLPKVNVAALIAAWGTGIPVVVSERSFPEADSSKLDKLTQFLRRKIYKWARTVVVQTSGIGNWVEKNCIGSHHTIIPNPSIFPLPVSVPIVKLESCIPVGKKIILGTGRLHEIKRFDRLINAFDLIANEHPNWDLVILGEGPERDSLEALGEKYALSNRIHLPGFAGNLADWYYGVDIYCLTSKHEGFPNTLLEAMSHGVASIAFDILTGPNDMIEKDVNGLLLPNDDHVYRLGAALKKLIEDDELRQKIAGAATGVRDSFAMDKIMFLWNEVLNETSKTSL